ncbi:MAG: hypothetical protein ACRDGR_00935 [bacterium]
MEELRTQMDDPSPGRTAYVGALFIVVFVLTVIALIGYFDRIRSEEFEVKVVDQPFDSVRDLRSQQLGKLEEYRWIDRGAGTVTIPIERAMELVVDERAAVTGGGS